jgi:uncharacterized protein (TIGR02996 family)
VEQEFLLAISANPRDWYARKVYADWLNEQGRDDEAEYHRGWDDAKQDAVEFMTCFAAEVVTEFYDNVTNPVAVEEVMQAARDYLKDGTSVCLSGDGFRAEGAFSDDDVREEFWRHFGVLEGCEVLDHVRKTPGGPFMCGC